MMVGLELVGFMIEKRWDKIANNHFVPHMFICFCMSFKLYNSSNSCLERVAALVLFVKCFFGFFPLLNGNIVCLLFFLSLFLQLWFLLGYILCCWRWIIRLRSGCHGLKYYGLKYFLTYHYLHLCHKHPRVPIYISIFLCLPFYILLLFCTNFLYEYSAVSISAFFRTLIWCWMSIEMCLSFFECKHGMLVWIYVGGTHTCFFFLYHIMERDGLPVVWGKAKARQMKFFLITHYPLFPTKGCCFFFCRLLKPIFPIRLLSLKSKLSYRNHVWGFLCQHQ